MSEVTAARVKELRERTGMGVHEAKRHLVREDLIADIKNATAFTDLRPLLLRTVELMP